MLNTLRNLRGISTIVALAGGLSIAAFTSSAFAFTRTDLTGGPTIVEFNGADLGGNAAYLKVWTGSTVYNAQLTAPCSTEAPQTVETLKVWASTAQAALLSGKTLTVFYNDCVFGGTTVHYIYDLALNR